MFELVAYDQLLSAIQDWKAGKRPSLPAPHHSTAVATAATESIGSRPPSGGVHAEASGLGPVYVDGDESDDVEDLPTRIHREMEPSAAGFDSGGPPTLNYGVNPLDSYQASVGLGAVRFDARPSEPVDSLRVQADPPLTFERWVEIEQALAVFVEAGHSDSDILGEFAMSGEDWSRACAWWSRYLQEHGALRGQELLRRYAQLQTFYRGHYSGALQEG